MSTDALVVVVCTANRKLFHFGNHISVCSITAKMQWFTLASKPLLGLHRLILDSQADKRRKGFDKELSFDRYKTLVISRACNTECSGPVAGSRQHFAELCKETQKLRFVISFLKSKCVDPRTV